MCSAHWLSCLAVLAVVGCVVGQDSPALVIGSLKTCGDKVQPTQDDLNQIAQGKLASKTSKDMIACIFKEASVMQDKKYNAANTFKFLSAFTPGEQTEEKVKLLTQLSEKCSSAATVANAAEEDIAVQIYDCLIREGNAMGANLSDVEMPKT